MLSAAEDIINRQNAGNSSTVAEHCKENFTARPCEVMSTGSVLLADILPTFFVKLTFPFFIHRIPYGTRHFVVVSMQTASFFIVAFATRIELSLFGVAIASFGSGFGEITYLALSSYFKDHSIAAFASGTGAAGILSALSYAALTEPYLAGISPETTLMIMLIVPVVFAIVYWFVIVLPETVHRVKLCEPHSLIAPAPGGNRNFDEPHFNNEENALQTEQEGTMSTSMPSSFGQRMHLVLPLLRFMIPLFVVYYGEYLINQGIVQMIVFTCSTGWALTASSQYRWYQVLYQTGVFISRSSVLFLKIPAIILPLLALLQLCNAGLALTEAIFSFVPHISIIFAIILYEGLLGGATYANAFHLIHKTVAPDVREYSLSVASVADACGIVAAAFSAIPVHNFVCRQPLHQ